MDEKNKYELEELFEAYRRRMGRVEQRLDECEPIEVDFDKLKAYRRDGWLSTGRVFSVAAVIALILFVLTPAADSYAMTSVVNRLDKIESVSNCLYGYGEES